MDAAGSLSWERVAASIQNAPDEREVLSLLEAFLKASPTAREAHQQGPTGLLDNATGTGGAVDTFGCADTSTWDQLVAQEQRYVDLSAQRDELQPRVDQLQARLVKIKRPLEIVLNCAGDGDGSILLLVLAGMFALLFWPVRSLARADQCAPPPSTAVRGWLRPRHMQLCCPYQPMHFLYHHTCTRAH